MFRKNCILAMIITLKEQNPAFNPNLGLGGYLNQR
jgi:hypothetical protein